jgi:hypothetical protein
MKLRSHSSLQSSRPERKSSIKERTHSSSARVTASSYSSSTFVLCASRQAGSAGEPASEHPIDTVMRGLLDD